MKVFLLSHDRAQPEFYFEDVPEPGGGPSTRPGLRGWLSRTTRRVKTSLSHPQGRLTRQLKRAWDWMQRRMDPDEPLLAALRSAPRIEVYHGSSLTSTEARDVWDAYLRRRLRRHFPWLAFNALLSPLALLLTPLPGPNVIGYWFAYRAVHHLLIVLGIRRVLGGRVEMTFHPVDGPDGCGGPGGGEGLTVAATRDELKGLPDYVERIATGPGASKTRGGSGGTQRSCDC